MTLADGQVVYADIIIGADGARSIVRPVVVEDDTPEAPSQMTIYTGTIPIATMETDPDMRSIVHDIGHPHWLGNGCLAMSTYLVFFSRLLGNCTASNFEMLTKVLLRLRSISHSASTSYFPSVICSPTSLSPSSAPEKNILPASGRLNRYLKERHKGGTHLYPLPASNTPR